MSARHEPRCFSFASSRIVSIDSSRARSMKAQVLTTRHSASSARSASGNPASVSMPSISSESTWFFGQPRVVRWTFIAFIAFIAGSQYTVRPTPVCRWRGCSLRYSSSLSARSGGLDGPTKPLALGGGPAAPGRPSGGRSVTAPLWSNAAVVRELERDTEILFLQHRDDLLEVVAVLAGHAHLILLDRGLHAHLRVLDQAHDLLGAVDRDPLLQRDLLPEGAAGGLLDVAIRERLQRHAALVQARLEDVDDRPELHVVGRGSGDVGLLDGHAALGALEVVAGVDLPPRLVERVGDLLHVDLARDVERVLGGHGPSAYLSGTITTPLGATKVKVRSGSPLFTAIFVKRIVTVFSNWSWTTAFRISQLFGSTDRSSRVRVGSGCLGVRSRAQLPSASFGWAGFRKRTWNSVRRRPRPARKLPAGPASASGASATLA